MFHFVFAYALTTFAIENKLCFFNYSLCTHNSCMSLVLRICRQLIIDGSFKICLIEFSVFCLNIYELVDCVSIWLVRLYQIKCKFSRENIKNVSNLRSYICFNDTQPDWISRSWNVIINFYLIYLHKSNFYSNFSAVSGPVIAFAITDGSGKQQILEFLAAFRPFSNSRKFPTVVLQKSSIV